jgi:hypothetical protein
VLKNWLSLDRRSLGFFRLALGLCLLIDLATRGLYFRAHYTSHGLFPLKDYLVQPGVDLRRWSLLFMNDDPWFVGLFFAISVLFAAALTLGYRVRLTGWICWVLWVSLFRRNPLITNAGDMYLPLLLFWGNFLPWGERFSIQQTSEGPADYSRLPAFCYQIQVCILYWFSAVLRGGPEWQVDYSALYFALRLERFQTVLSPWLLTLGADVLAAITYLTLALELLGPFFLLLPWWRMRAVCVLLIVIFHLGIVAGLNIPMFALIGALGPLGILPGKVWELTPLVALDRKLSAGFSDLGHILRVSSTVPGKYSQPDEGLRKAYPWLTLPAMGLVLFGLYRGLYYPDQPNFLLGIVRVFSLDQRWGMFSPGPPHLSGWERVPATTKSGRTVELLSQEDLELDQIAGPHHNKPYDTRWFNLHMVLATERPGHTELYLRYLVEKWNLAHPEDPILTARYEFHTRNNPPGFMLGDLGVRVYASYTR